MKTLASIVSVLLLAFALRLPAPQNFQQRIAFTNSLAAGGGGGTTNWVDASTFAATDTDSFSTATGDSYDVVTFSGSGTVSALRIYISGFSGADTVKMAIYTSGGSLLASGSATASGTGYLTVPLGSSASVTATGYYVAWETSGGNLTYRYLSGSTGFEAGATTYASFPASPKPSTSSFARKYAVSAQLVTP